MDKSPSPNLISQYFCSPFIKQYFDMEDPPSNLPSKYHHLFSLKPSHVDSIEVISYISSIWEDDHIERLENNQWKCLWCNIEFQVINATKALAHVIGTKCMHIDRCMASIDQSHLSRYKVLQTIKAAKKGLLNDYLHKMISSISRLQDKSSYVVQSNIQRNSRGMYSSNLTAAYDTSSFSKICSIQPENNQITTKKGSIFYG